MNNKYLALIAILCCLIPIVALLIIYGSVPGGQNSTISNKCPSTANCSIQNQTIVNNASQTIGTNVGDNAPDFSLQNPEKGTITKSTFQGKPLFIFFTTTYCVPCQIGAQNLAKYYDETGGNAFNVLIVFVDQSETDTQFISWRNNYGRSNWYIAKDNGIAQTYKVQYLDTKYILDKSGTIKWFSVAPLTYEGIKPVIDPLLK